MFNDRDLGILGGGALLAVLCLFLPLSFVGRVAAGFLALAGFMALALLRLGPDRVPPEVWLLRRVRFAVQARRYVNQQVPSRWESPSRPVSESHGGAESPPPAPGPAPSPAPFSAPFLRPVDLAWEEIGIHPLLSVLLGVVGVYFAAWLADGGAQELSLWFQ